MTTHAHQVNMIFSVEELGTIAMLRVQRLFEIDTKRKRKALFNELRPLFPKDSELVAITLGADRNGTLVVIASFDIKQPESK